MLRYRYLCDIAFIEGTDICHQVYDGDPADSECTAEVGLFQNLCFERNSKLIMNPMNTSIQDIDVPIYKAPWKKNGSISAF